MTQKTILLSLLLCFATLAQAQKNKEGIKWLSFVQLEKVMKTQPRYILVDVGADWCVYCKMLDKTTLSKQKVAKVLNKYFYAVKLNAEYPQTIRFGGQTFPFITQSNSKGIQGLTLALKVKSYPTLVILAPDYQVIHREKGYVKAKKLAPILAFLGGEAYKTQSWETFIRAYKKKRKRRGK